MGSEFRVQGSGFKSYRMIYFLAPWAISPEPLHNWQNAGGLERAFLLINPPNREFGNFLQLSKVRRQALNRLFFRAD